MGRETIIQIKNNQNNDGGETVKQIKNSQNYDGRGTIISNTGFDNERS